MSTPLLHLRVFISSPGDVAEERDLARRVLMDELPQLPAFRGRIKFDVVSWDDPAARVPLLANEQPQTSVNRFLPRPSDCDIVIAVLWARVGTPFDVNGEEYSSGTEWEIRDALETPGGRDVLIYKRTEVPKLELDDPEFESKRFQWEQVQKLLERFYEDDGRALSGYNRYVTPVDFAIQLRQHLEQLVWTKLVAQTVEQELYAFPEAGHAGDVLGNNSQAAKNAEGKSGPTTPRRIDVAVTQDMLAAIDLVIERESVTLTEAVRRLISYGDLVYRQVRVNGDTLFFRGEDGTEREILLL